MRVSVIGLVAKSLVSGVYEMTQTTQRAQAFPWRISFHLISMIVHTCLCFLTCAPGVPEACPQWSTVWLGQLTLA